ncbi:MAG TPA: hypothetical protein VGE35_04005 [Candidatus Paceibacterota bacterium]
MESFTLILFSRGVFAHVLGVTDPIKIEPVGLKRPQGESQTIAALPVWKITIGRKYRPERGMRYDLGPASMIVRNVRLNGDAGKEHHTFYCESTFEIQGREKGQDRSQSLIDAGWSPADLTSDDLIGLYGTKF